MKILLPVVGTFASVNAAKEAAQIAEKYGFTIKMLHVVGAGELRAYKRNARLWRKADGSVLNGNVRPIDDEEARKKLEKRSSAILNAVISRLDSDSIQIETELCFGKPAANIVKTAKAEGFGLIVMANGGPSGIRRRFAGAVARKVISGAPCPVLVIPTDA